MTVTEKQQLDLEEYSRVYDKIEAKAKATVEYFIKNSDITGEDSATIIASVINNIVDKSLQAVKMGIDSSMAIDLHSKNILIADEKVKQSVNNTSISKTKSELDSSLKPYQIDSARLDNELKTKKKVTIDKSDSKIDADRAFVQNQSNQLTASVGYNNKIKTLDSLSDLWGTLGAGGLVVPESGWKPIFEIANDLANTTVPTLSSFQSDITTK